MRYHVRVSLIFLGTGAPDAGSDDMPAVAMKLGSTVLLLDSGEGVQHKLARTGIGSVKVSYILVTHLHGDHVLGLVPLIQTRALTSKPPQTITLLGPPGLRRFLDVNFDLLYFDPGNTVEVWELGGGEEIKVRDMKIRTETLDHTIPTLGYSISIDGELSVCYWTDTRPIGRDKLTATCSILIHDSTFSWVDLDKAMDFKHSTALEAASVAEILKVKVLFLYHISSRYKDRELLEREARRLWRHSYVATKYMALSV